MTNGKSLKRALLSSAFSLIICVAMLIGTTFAWFTDTASTAVNKIQAGNLDVALEMQKADGTWESAEGKTLTFKTADNRAAENILWEPGCRYELPALRVVNNGNLALKYKLAITGIKGDAKLNEAIEWTINDSDINLTEEHLLAGKKSAAITVKGHMKESAGNEYQGLSIDGIGITVYAAQYSYENDSKDNTYDKDAEYASGANIIGLGKTYDTLTAAAKAWRESKGIVTSGSQFGYNTLNDTVDSIAWIISGEVEIGDGEGVIGSNGAGNSIFGGGYYTPGVTVNNITISGVNGAKITKTGDSYLVSAAGKNVVYENITFTDTVRIDSNPSNLTFKNCKFEAGFRMPHSAADGNVTIENCTFTGNESGGYAVFAQGNMASFKIAGNEISNCRRGINIQAGDNAVVTISGNTIKNITGKTENGFTYGAAIQMTSAESFTVTDNVISDVAVNALHIYNGCPAKNITIKNNSISAAYLCWNEADYDMNKVISAGNTISIVNEGKCVNKTEVIDSSFTLE